MLLRHLASKNVVLHLPSLTLSNIAWYNYENEENAGSVHCKHTVPCTYLTCVLVLLCLIKTSAALSSMYTSILKEQKVWNSCSEREQTLLTSGTGRSWAGHVGRGRVIGTETWGRRTWLKREETVRNIRKSTQFSVPCWWSIILTGYRTIIRSGIKEKS